MDFFATAAKGTEGALRDELRELKFRGVRAERGGVHFAGAREDGWRACIESRIAMRVLAVLGAFDAPTGQALYDGVRAIDLDREVSPRTTIAVSATSRKSALTNTVFVAQKTKDAVVDRVRDRVGSRPSVDPKDPDVALRVHIVRDRAEVYLDLSGEALHRRGYRRDMAQAPLKETLAAAILRLAGWDRARPLLDPMCGTGTFGIEATLWARDVPPGLERRFGFERWADFDPGARERLDALRASLRARIRADGPDIVSSDIDEAAVAATRANARAAGVTLRVERRDVRSIEPTRPAGFVVVNPPYGERLVGSDALYREMAGAFARLAGHRIAVLAGSPAIVRALPRGAGEHTLFNGAIECRLVTYEV